MVQYTYNSKGQVLTEKYTDTGRTVTYTYNARDALATRHDSSTNILTRYFYDPQGRVTSTREENYRTAYEYDHLGNVTKAYEYISGDFYGIEYAYDEQNRPSFTRFGALTNSTALSGPGVGYEYDDLGRVISRDIISATSEQIVYEDGSNRVYSFTVGGNTSYYYTYDDNGNITSISNDDGGVDYTYDSQNQLIREDNGWARKTFVWTYDNAGNITSEKEYAYTLGVPGTPISTKNYTYGNASWGDLLTGYNGKTFTYDTIGNPLSDGTWSYTWQQGRQLVQMAKTGEIWNFTYNTDGLRTSRSNGTTAYNYVYTNGQLRQMTCGSNKLVFGYGVDGRPYAVQYNGTDYYYLLNLQGDVVGIVNASGTQVVSYTYDAWGNILSTSGSMASTLGQMNPLRYRGYVYDTETGLYYIISRYYNPEIGRWINADDIDYLGADGSPLSYNLFAYCMNNPVNRFDVNGNWSLSNWAKMAIGAVATIAAVAVTVATGGAAAPVLIGVAASTIGGAAVSAVNHRVATGSWEGAGKAALDGAADGFMTGGLCALGGSVVGGAARTIKNAKSGITIGKVGTFEDVAALAKTRHYSGLKEFNFIKKVAGQKAAETVGWWQNKCVVKGVMALKGAIYDCGGTLTGAYAKEVALTKGYQYLYNVWLM